MSVPQETIWEAQPHAAAKSVRFSQAVSTRRSNSSSADSRIVYVDGFSGPGRYSGGEPGSPIIALESARTHRANLAGELVFLFVEERGTESIISIAKSAASNYLPISKSMSSAERSQEKPDRQTRSTRRRRSPDRSTFASSTHSVFRYSLRPDKPPPLQRSESVGSAFVVDAINRWLTHPDPHVEPGTSPKSSAPMRPSQ